MCMDGTCATPGETEGSTETEGPMETEGSTGAMETGGGSSSGATTGASTTTSPGCTGYTYEAAPVPVTDWSCESLGLTIDLEPAMFVPRYTTGDDAQAQQLHEQGVCAGGCSNCLPEHTPSSWEDVAMGLAESVQEQCLEEIWGTPCEGEVSLCQDLYDTYLANRVDPVDIPWMQRVQGEPLPGPSCDSPAIFSCEGGDETGSADESTGGADGSTGEGSEVTPWDLTQVTCEKSDCVVKMGLAWDVASSVEQFQEDGFELRAVKVRDGDQVVMGQEIVIPRRVQGGHWGPTDSELLMRKLGLQVGDTLFGIASGVDVDHLSAFEPVTWSKFHDVLFASTLSYGANAAVGVEVVTRRGSRKMVTLTLVD